MTWWSASCFYEIYVRSFQDSNDDGVGDLNGVTGRLPYLQDLGVNALWITPFYPSPQVDFGYDVSDHEAVDPLFGTLADFDRLLAEAHRRGHPRRHRHRAQSHVRSPRVVRGVARVAWLCPSRLVRLA